MKTVKEWAEMLPEDVRVKFLANVDEEYEDYTEEYMCLGVCILSSFNWSDTKEGYNYWSEVWNEIYSKPEQL